MRKPFLTLIAVAALALPSALFAELVQGAKAPLFRTSVALAGKAKPFSLGDALKRGPVVLYFYPKAFTQGCTLEAHAFAEATDDFTALGATVVGLSVDDLPTLQKFSTEACRDKFAVGVATPQIVRDYDVALKREGAPANITSRTSYVIDRGGRIVLVHSDMNYRDHVKLTLEAVRKLSGKP